MIKPLVLLVVLIAASCSPPLDESEAISGTMFYVNIVGSVRSGLFVVPRRNIYPASAAVEYTIFPSLPDGVSLHDTGEIRGTPTEESRSRPYVVKASGIDTHKDIVYSNVFFLTIDSSSSNPTNIKNSSIWYENTVGIVGTSLTVGSSKSVVPSIATVRYSIIPPLPRGLMFDRNTGKITGIPTEESASTDYVVTITAAGSYTGSISSDSFTITIVNSGDISGSIIRYTDISGGVGIRLSVSPISNIPSDATVKYSIDPLLLPEGLLFASATESSLELR